MINAQHNVITDFQKFKKVQVANNTDIHSNQIDKYYIIMKNTEINYITSTINLTEKEPLIRKQIN